MGFIRQGKASTGQVESSLAVKPGLAKFASGSAKENFVVDKSLTTKELVDLKVKKPLGG